jgi:hypothetical protein
MMFQLDTLKKLKEKWATMTALRRVVPAPVSVVFNVGSPDAQTELAQVK